MPNLHLNEHAEPIADRLRLTLTCLSEMRGAYPEIPLPPDIDRAALGEEAFFVTLPLGQAGARSRNQRRYSRAAVEQMVAQINSQRPEGMWGHVTPDETSTRYDPPAIRWLAAVIDAEGIAWGKGLPLTAQARDYYRLAKATNARVGTSLVAWAHMDGDEVAALELVTVDLADPARVGVPMTAAKAHLSKEMQSTEKDSTQRRKERQMQDTKGFVGALVASNAHAMPDVLLPSPGTGEGSGVRSDLTALHEMLGGSDVIDRVKLLLEECSDLHTEREALLNAAITAQVERAVRVPSASGLVEQLVRARQPHTLTEIGDAVAAVVTSEGVQAFLREALVREAGPAQRRPIRREGEPSGFFSF
jgi:hypothetical protein